MGCCTMCDMLCSFAVRQPPYGQTMLLAQPMQCLACCLTRSGLSRGSWVPLAGNAEHAEHIDGHI